MTEAIAVSEEVEFLKRLNRNSGSNFDFSIVDDGVNIKWHDSPDTLEFRHSYSEARFLKRMRQPGQALLKACNNRQHSIKKLLDLTGGWGVDSFILAHHGLSVTTLEQNELVFNISAHSLNYARSISSTSAAAKRIELIHTSSVDFLLGLDDATSFDCIYLDPMFPDHKSTAKPARDMQILQHLTDNQDIELCFELALEKAGNRVVVKRPAKSGPISDLAPDLVYKQKTIRFDVYLTNNPVGA